MRAVGRFLSRLPAWVTLLIAVACVVIGAFLTVRPFTSAGVLIVLAGVVAVVTGVLTLVSQDDKSPAYHLLPGIGWIAVGVAVLAWPGLSLRALAIVVGIALVVNGMGGMVKALARRSEEPAAELIGGAAGTVFGSLALSWPDVTVLVIAVLFGARTVLFGLSQLTGVISRWRRPAREAGAPRATQPPSRFRRGLRVAGRSVAVVVALGLLLLSVALRSQAAGPVSAFYDTPATVSTTPGKLLRVQPFTKAVPGTARAWLILYSTRTSRGKPAVGTAIVAAAKKLPPGPRPIVLWNHGTVGVARTCAPSLFANPFDGAPAIPELLGQGWVMVAPDYVGTGTEGPTPYLIGPGEAYSALDAARAARQLHGLSLSGQTVVWGHSQGGHAALWTGRLAASYAPSLKIDGVAALAPATDLLSLAKTVQGKTLGNVVAAYLLAAYANTYPHVRIDDYVRPGARVAVAEAAKRCVVDPGLAASVAISRLQPTAVFSGSLETGPLASRLRQNTPTADVGDAPLLVAQGTDDEVIPITITEAWVRQQCAAGYKLDFRTYSALSHMGVVAATSPLIQQLITWTTDRFAGKPASNTC